MKKNRMMRLASILLVCVLLTTSVISGTFAKYTSTASASDTARVAKWGWGSTTISIDLFDDTYDGTVDSADDANVIAPGTKKTGKLIWTPAASFAPEVDYTLSFAIDNTTDIPAILEAELDWVLKIDSVETTYTTFDALKAALEAKTYSGEASVVGPTVDIEIGWVWAFDGGDDAADTYLGNMDTLADLNIDITMTATQVN